MISFPSFAALYDCLAKALPDIIMYPYTEVQGNSVASSSKEENDK